MGLNVIVTHVIIGLNVGGAERMLQRLVLTNSTETGITHRVVSLTDLGAIGQELREKGIQVNTLNATGFVSLVKVFFDLRRYFKRMKPTIVHTWMYHADLIGGLAAYSVGIRNIIWCVRSTDISKGGSKVTLLIRRVCALMSSMIPLRIVYAAFASKEIHESLGYDAGKSIVIPNGFDFDTLNRSKTDIDAFRHDLGFDHANRVIISVGRYSPVKDHETFLKAAKILCEKYPDIRFLLVGRGLEVGNSELQSGIRQTGYEKKFVLLGERTDVADCLRASDIFCLHSVTEGFPNVLGEAMTIGLPCVTTDVGDAFYLLNQPEYVTAPKDPVQLAAAIEVLLNKTSFELKGIGHVNQKRVQANFVMDAISSKYLELYETVYGAGA